MDWVMIITRYYPKYYSLEQTKIFVDKGKITSVQFQEITGEDYVA